MKHSTSSSPVYLFAFLAVTLFTVATASAAPTETILLTGNLTLSTDFSRHVPNPATYAALDAVMDQRADFAITDPRGAVHPARAYIIRQFYDIFLLLVYVDAGDAGGTAGTPKQIYGDTITHDLAGGVARPLPFGLSDPIPWNSGGGQIVRIDVTHLPLPLSGFATLSADPLSGGNYTSQLTLAGNLNADAPLTTGIDTATFESLQRSSQLQTTLEVSASDNSRHTVQVHFFHTAANTWSARGYADGSELTGQSAGQPVQLFSLPLTYAVSGATVPVAPAVTIGALHWANGADGQAILVLANPVTQFYAPSRMLTYVSPELVPTPTPTPTPGPSDCSSLRRCMVSSVDTAMNACQAAASSCTQSAESLAITPEALAHRAIETAHCANRSRSSCHRCYRRAVRLVARGKDTELFHGLLAEAEALVRTAEQSACR